MKILFLFALLFGSISLYAQDENPRSFILGGSLGFYASNNPYPVSALRFNGSLPIIYPTGVSGSDTKFRALTLSPYAGRQLNEHWTLGIGLFYQKEKFENPFAYYFNVQDPVHLEQKSNQGGLELFARYTFNPQSKFNIFIEPSLAYTRRNEKEYRDNLLVFEENSWYASAGVRLGALYQLTDKFRITARSGSINFHYGQYEVPNTEVGNNFTNFQTNLSLSNIVLGLELKL